MTWSTATANCTKRFYDHMLEQMLKGQDDAIARHVLLPARAGDGNNEIDTHLLHMDGI